MIEAGGHAFALDRRAVRRLVFFCDLAPPALAPPFVVGALNLAGEAIPVLSLARLLELADAPPDIYAQILVVEGKGGPIGLLVDHSHGSVRADAATLAAVQPGASFNGCVAGELRSPYGPASAISLDRLLLEAESRTVEHFRVLAQARIDAVDAAAGSA